MRRRSLGFSLLEVLVALFLFALLGVAANRFLHIIIKTEEVAERHSDVLQKQLRAVELIRRDFFQAVPRTFRDETGIRRPAFLVQSGQYQVVFTRSGWLNPTGVPRSDLMHVAYGIGPKPKSEHDETEDKKQYLLRYYWAYPDLSTNTPVQVQALVQGVERLDWRFLDNKGRWLTEWPPEETPGSSAEKVSTALPRAVELTLHFEGGDVLKRLLLMPEYP